MTNEQLVARIRAREDVSGNMLQLWQQVKAFIHILAKLSYTYTHAYMYMYTYTRTHAYPYMYTP